MDHEGAPVAEPADADTPFRQFFELAPDAVIIAELTGPIVLANRQAERCFGYRRDELIGAEIELLLPRRYRARHPALREGYARQPHVRPMGIGLDLYGVRKDGSEFPVEISLSPVMFSGKECVIAVVRDVTEQKRLARQARDALNTMLTMAEERRKLLQFVLDELPGGVYLTRGPDARLVLANYAAEAAWGARWPIGQPMREFLATTGVQILDQEGRPLAEAALATVRAARTGEEIRHQQEIIRRPDGLTLPILLNAVALESRLLNWELTFADEPPTPIAATDANPAPHLDTTNHPTASHDMGAAPVYASLVVLQDISAVKEAERLKDEFIAIAAHELKTPMAAVRGYAEMLARDLQRDQRDGEQAPADDTIRAEATIWRQEALAVIDDATQRLVELVDDLLDVTRLQAGRLELRREPHDLVALARRVTRRMQGTTTRHTITLRANDGPVVAEIDVARIEQALISLLSNAIKYSPAGGEIAVSVGMATADSAGTQPGAKYSDGNVDAQPGIGEISVRDSGVGIPDDQRGRIFGRFSRAENAVALGIGGVGLGLYLCRELVERHGGRIWFQPNATDGVTFFVTLPLALIEDQENA
ncbi:MAG TPA: PAS domain S-box protein [Ktedonobacterales bacterium]|nr:PAS domain S-box protein [Ktedonobacterales bacterium]